MKNRFAWVLIHGQKVCVESSKDIDLLLKKHHNIQDELKNYLIELKQKFLKTEKEIICEVTNNSLKIQNSIINYFEGVFKKAKKEISVSFSIEDDEIKFHSLIEKRDRKHITSFISSKKEEILSLESAV